MAHAETVLAGARLVGPPVFAVNLVGGGGGALLFASAGELDRAIDELRLALRLDPANARRIVEEAVRGMLPKTKMGRQMATKLKVYRGDKHPHQAQGPVMMPT